MGHFRHLSVHLVTVLCPVNAVYSRQPLAIRVGKNETSLARGFVKARQNLVE